MFTKSFRTLPEGQNPATAEHLLPLDLSFISQPNKGPTILHGLHMRHELLLSALELLIADGSPTREKILARTRE
jgi:hypothetical protein